MSDDEEDDVTTTKRKKLTKKGRTTVAEDSSSEDDDLFGSDNEEEEVSNKNRPEEAIDTKFSKERLKSAMNDAKSFISPNIEFSKFLETWDDVDKFVVAKKFHLSDPSGLVKFLSNVDSPPSLELKCLITAVALQTCVLAKAQNDRSMAQGLFKSKIKSDKSMHVGNFVSNTWLKDSVAQLKKSDTIDDPKNNNMLLTLLTTGFAFMQNCFVIDNEKKLNVLKEKQGIDWKGTTSAILQIASSKKLGSLESLAKTLTTYLSDFQPTSNAAGTTTPGGPNKLTRTSSVDAQTLLDATRKKREERMKKLRKKAHGAMTLASNVGDSATSSMPSAVAPPPVPPSSYASSSATTATTTTTTRSSMSGGGYDQFVGSSNTAAAVPSSHTSQDSSRWNTPDVPPPAPAPAPPATTPSAWGSQSVAGDGPSQSSYQDQGQGNYSSSTSAHQDSNTGSRSQPAATDDSYNNQNRWQSSNDYSSAAPAPAPPQGSYSADGRYDDSYRDPSSNGRDQGGYDPSRNNYDRPVDVNSGPSDAPPAAGGGRGRMSNHPHDNNDDYPPPPSKQSRGEYDQKSYHGGDSYYPGPSASDAMGSNASGSVHDNQPGGGEWDRRGGGGGGYDRAPPPQHGDSPYHGGGGGRNYDRYDDHQYQRGGSGGGGNRDGGRDNYGGSSSSSSKRSRQDAFADEVPQTGGGGRGRGRTLPAWMTTNEDSAGNRGSSSSSSGLPPPKRHEGPPPHDMPPRHIPPRDMSSGSLPGSGRGRGRTLPAWMTTNDSGPSGVGGGTGDYPPPPQHHHLPPLPESLPPPPSSQSRGPPRGPPPPSFDEPPMPGGGRGRGRTLPAWMTQNDGGPGGR